MIPEYVPSYVYLGVFAFCLTLGIIVGLLAAMFSRLGIFLVGSWIGGTAGMMIYNSLLSQIVGGKGGNTLFWGVIVVCVIIGGIVATILFKHAVVVGSSLCGAYCLVRVLYLAFSRCLMLYLGMCSLCRWLSE